MGTKTNIRRACVATLGTLVVAGAGFLILDTPKNPQPSVDSLITADVSALPTLSRQSNLAAPQGPTEMTQPELAEVTSSPSVAYAELPDAQLPTGLAHAMLVSQEIVPERRGFKRLSVFATGGALGRILAVEEIRENQVVQQELFSADHLVVSSADANTLRELASDLQAIGFQIRQMPQSNFFYVLAPSGGPLALLNGRDHLEDMLPKGASVEMDALGSAGAVPSDPSYGVQYHHGLIQSEDAWDLSTGSDAITVAVLDTGLHMTGAEFSGRILPGYDYANYDSDPTDDNGHGTAVAGVIAANASNGAAIAGMDWNCNVMPVKVLDSSNYGYYSWWTSGINYAVSNGARVINLSAGGSSSSSSMTDAIDNAIANGVIFVTVTHNDGSSAIRFPGRLFQAITVGATTSSDVRAYYSNYGSAIDLVAPGSGIATVNRYGNLSYYSGTSFSAPQVAGVAALMLSMDPTLQQADVEALLTQGAEDQVGDNLDTLGFDYYYGWGRLNVFNTLQMLAPTPEPSDDIVADGTFDTDFEANTTAGRVYPTDTGWKVAGSRVWSWDATNKVARATPGGSKGMVQVIADAGATTGSQTLSFNVTNTEAASIDFRVFAWGVNGTNFEVSNWNTNGPVDGNNTPLGVDLLVNSADGDLSVVSGTNFVEVPLDLGSGYDSIVIMFWSAGATAPAVHEVDNVMLGTPSSGGGTNLVVSGDFSNPLTASGSWIHSDNPADVDSGWQVKAIDDSWTIVDGYVEIAGGGVPGLAQIIHDDRMTTGKQTFSFDFANTTATADVEVYVYGVNEEFGLSLYETRGPRRRSDINIDLTNGLDGALLLGDDSLALQYLPEFTTMSYDNEGPTDQRLDFGGGYDYIVILYSASRVRAGEYVRIDNVVIGGSAPAPDPDPVAAIHETFDWATSLDDSLGNNGGTASGPGGLTWTYDRAGYSSVKSISGTSLLLQRPLASGPSGSIQANLPIGISSFAITFKPRYDGDAQIRVTIGDTEFTSAVITGHTTTAILTGTVDASAGQEILIESIGATDNKDVIIDDLELFSN